MQISLLERLLESGDIDGVSDHSMAEDAIKQFFVMPQCKVFEKHICESKDDVGPDIACSSTPDAIRTVLKELFPNG